MLSPVIFVVNEKLATRSGLVGRFGRFFAFGPREFGYHPTNRMFILINRRLLSVQAFFCHRYSYFKTLTHNGYHMVRPFKGVNFIGPMFALMSMAAFSFTGYGQQTGYEPDRLHNLKNKLGRDNGIPLNSLNYRLSAHYMEINKIYCALQCKNYSAVKKGIMAERDEASVMERKTRYADASYEYIPITPPKRNLPSLEQCVTMFD